MRKPLPAALNLLAAALLAGCPTMQPSTDAPPLDGTAWVLAALPGRTLVGGAPATLRFEDGRAQGSDGCNRFSAPYTVKRAALEVSARGASTQMACPTEVTKQAAAFMAALSGAKTYRVAAGELRLLAADGTVLAALSAQPQSLAGTAWRVTGINNGKNAVVSVLAGSTVTMAFVADGQASGSAGCNRYAAHYEADGSRLRFQAPAATRRMCAGEGLMEQEQTFLKALESVASMRMDGNRLELRTPEGALAITLLREGGA